MLRSGALARSLRVALSQPSRTPNPSFSRSFETALVRSSGIDLLVFFITESYMAHFAAHHASHTISITTDGGGIYR